MPNQPVMTKMFKMPAMSLNTLCQPPCSSTPSVEIHVVPNARTAVSLVCLLVVARGILSGVQVGSMSSKLPGAGVLLVAAVVFTAFTGTLLGASSQVMCACISRAGRRASWNLVGAAAACGAVVMVLTVLTFAAINTASPNLAAVGGLFALDAAVNVAMLLVAARFTK